MKRHSVPARRIAGSIAAAALWAAAGQAAAAGAVGFQNWNGGIGNAPTVALGETITATKSLLQSNYSDNPNLWNSAWAHAGGSPWYVFNLTGTANVSIDLTPTNPAANFAPGITVWASGSSPFDGGSDGVEVGYNGWDAPHSFNAVGQVGDYGTHWASGSDGNLQQTLAYAVTGPSHTDTASNGWGESIKSGVNDISLDDTFVKGVTGTASGNAIHLNFNQLQAGWYVAFIGGTDYRLSSAEYGLAVSAAAVPEPETWGLMLVGLGALALRRTRRKA